MAKKPELISATDYAKTLNGMTPEVKEAFSRMQVAVHSLTHAAVQFAMAESDYMDAKIKAAKKG